MGSVLGVVSKDQRIRGKGDAFKILYTFSKFQSEMKWDEEHNEDRSYQTLPDFPFHDIKQFSDTVLQPFTIGLFQAGSLGSN